MRDNALMRDDAPDPHLATLERTADALLRRFPNAGVGVTGSVGAGTHHAGSDLDLLVVDDGIVRDWQLAVHEGGVRVNVVCAHPARFAAQLRADAPRFAAVGASYVLSARALRDPAGHLAALQAAARAAVGMRESARGELLARAEATARDLLSHHAAENGRWAVAASVWTTVEAAHLAAGRTALEKGDGRRPFEVLARADPELHALARTALTGGGPPAEAVEAVERMIARVFGPERGAGHG